MNTEKSCYNLAENKGTCCWCQRIEGKEIRKLEMVWCATARSMKLFRSYDHVRVISEKRLVIILESKNLDIFMFKVEFII